MGFEAEENLEEAFEAEEDLLEDDLEEFRRVKHGVIAKMTYNHVMPDDIVANGNQCTRAERERLWSATGKALEILKKSKANYDEKLFRKWFGVNTDKQTDTMVKTRIQNTYDFMNGGYTKDWDTVCCHNSKGSCSGCSGTTLAYVMGTHADSGSKTSWTWVRVCPSQM